jgi:hypothetical protein
MHCQDQHLRAGQIAENMTRRSQAIEPWHTDVHHDQVGFQALRFFNGRPPIGGFPTNIPFRPHLENRADAFSDDLMIVHKKNAICHGSLCPQPGRRTW